MQFSTIALVGRYQDSQLADHLRSLARMVNAAGREVLIEAETAKNTGLTEFPVASFEEIGRRAQLAIVMGGDGTMLGAARSLAPAGVPVAGINHGRLGFITDIPLQDTHSALEDLLQGNFEIESRILLEGEVMRDGKCLYSATALNDVVLNRAGRGGMIEVRADINGQFMFTVRADGLIAATPTGSTAYALSALGPILHPTIRAILLVPVAPQTLSNRPIVLPDSSQLNLTVLSMSRIEAGASVHFDMQTWSDVQPGDQVNVRRAQNTVNFLHPRGYSFFSTLRKKLDWNRLPATGHNGE
ncbi:NAD kinase [Orrella marina]|uniref:NAD kinase n=1 Tax=Orrella marina TaxID=2163011 RepID=A0A2R4XK68_9BURK|nr:NAD kinase [Orrella marina]AWB34168.1 NAD kinase [Orrella marina]